MLINTNETSSKLTLSDRQPFWTSALVSRGCIYPRDSSFWLLGKKGGFRRHQICFVFISSHLYSQIHLFNCPRHAFVVSTYETRSSLIFYGLVSPTFYDAIQIQQLMFLLGTEREFSRFLLLP